MKKFSNYQIPPGEGGTKTNIQKYQIKKSLPLPYGSENTNCRIH